MRINRLLGGIGMFLVIGFLAACATIMHGTKQGVGISSTPSSASVTINNMPRGMTPLVADLSRRDNHIVKIVLDGYMPFETTLTRKVSGWVWGNVLFGGLIGLAVDAITGGLYNLTPEQIAGVLQKQNADLLYKKDRLYIAVVLSPEPTWQKIGMLQPMGNR
jgi:hypothetical protein